MKTLLKSFRFPPLMSWWAYQQALIARVLICFILGISFYFLESSQNFDFRFKVRGDQPIDPSILILKFSESDIALDHQQALKTLTINSVIAIEEPDSQDRHDWPDLDEDGVLRKLRLSLSPIKNSFPRLVLKKAEDQNEFNSPLFINFRGGVRRFPELTMTQILSPDFNLENLNGKNLILDFSTEKEQSFRTPVGAMQKAQLAALLIDNFNFDRFIKMIPFSVLASLMLVLLALSVVVILSYPQGLVITILIWLCTGWITLSFWIFDHFNYWLPILSPTGMVLFTYMIFLGYRLTKKELETWRLEQEKKYLSEVEQLKNNFFSLISHDLKTPIAKIQSICDRLLLKTKDQTDLAKDIQSLRKENEELNRYIKTIIRMNRVESHDFKPELIATDVNELILRATKQLEEIAQEKKIRLEHQLEPIFSIEIDPTMIFEVLLNLIENAIKYTPEQGHIRVVSKELDDLVTIFIEDNGLGIPWEEQGKVFDKFYRAKSADPGSKGSGLGLYLVKYFVELHRGEVFLESKPGQGTRIGIKLPIDIESGDEIDEKNSMFDS